jgi:hypothetical protein
MKISTLKLTGHAGQVKLMSLVTALMLVTVIVFLVARSSVTYKQVQGQYVQPDTLPANSIDLEYVNFKPTFPFHLVNATEYANNAIRIDLWFFQLKGTLFNSTLDAFVVYGEANIYPATGYQIKSPPKIPLLSTPDPPIVFEMNLKGNLSSAPIINWDMGDFTYVNDREITWVVQANSHSLLNSSNGPYLASYNVTPYQQDIRTSGTRNSEAQIWPEAPDTPQEHRLAVFIEGDRGKNVLNFSADLTVDFGKPYVGDIWANGIALSVALNVDYIANSFP